MARKKPPQPDDDQEHQEAFEHYCEVRQKAYRRIFGTEEPKDQILLPGFDDALFIWPGGGVFQFPPQKKRRHWYYVTEAVSQPREPAKAIKEGYPHYSFELVISCAEQNSWAPGVLMNLARYVLGPKGRPFHPDQACPCNGPLVLGTQTSLNFLITVASDDYPTAIQLPGGECSLVHLIGVAEAEVAPAFDIDDPPLGIRALYRLLCKHGVGACSIPERQPLSDSPTFLDEWTAELETVRAAARS